VLDRHLSDLGTSTASGLFTKSLEVKTKIIYIKYLCRILFNLFPRKEQLLKGATSFAVHSLKDMPTELPEGLVLGAVCKRESPEDAVIIHPKHKNKVRVYILRLK
jgi:hydroxymethylbilane synthase